MASPEIPERDPLDELLTIPAPGQGDRMRPLLLAQTTSVVRRRRIVRRLGVLGALAACYLAGVVTAGGWKLASISPDGSVGEKQAGPEGAPREGVRPTPERPSSPKALPQRPGQRPQRRDAALAQADFEQIRRVSDRYLRDKGDIATALHYYGRALNRASTEERTISVEEDSWLLMALKQARIEEDQNDDSDT